MRLGIYYSRTSKRDLGRLWKRHSKFGVVLLPLGRCGHFNFTDRSSLGERCRPIEYLYKRAPVRDATVHTALLVP